MSDRLSLGPVQVFDTTIFSLNDGFRQLSDRIDALKGLRGRAEVFDRVRVEDPTVEKDAVNLATRDADDVVTSPTGRMTYGSDVIKYTDVNGTDLHGFGNI